MGEFVKVAHAADIPPGQGKVVEVGGTQIALFNVDGAYFAVHNTCQHQGGPLGEGSVTGTVITCPWHGWRYDLNTGKCLTLTDARVARFEVKLDGDNVMIDPDPAGA